MNNQIGYDKEEELEFLTERTKKKKSKKNSVRILSHRKDEDLSARKNHDNKMTKATTGNNGEAVNLDTNVNNKINPCRKINRASTLPIGTYLLDIEPGGEGDESQPNPNHVEDMYKDKKHSTLSNPEVQYSPGSVQRRNRSQSSISQPGVKSNSNNEFMFAKAKTQPELISLSNMPRELRMEKGNSSISFSGIGFMVETMQKLHAKITDKKPEIERAVLDEDFNSLISLISQDENALTCAAFTAVREDKGEILANILDMANEEVVKAVERPGDGSDGLLHLAVKKSALSCCEVLLQKGFNPNAWTLSQDTDGYSPLHVAATSGNLGALDLLAEKKAAGNLNLGEDSDGNSVIHAAVRANQAATVLYLIDKKVNKMGGRGKFTETTLHTAAENNYAEIAELLLNSGVLVDALRGADTRETALHVAATNGYVETTAVLLSHGADACARDARGRAPLHLAAGTLSLGVMRLLIDHGADVDAVDSEGRPPLHFAINSKLKGAGECVNFLIEKGAGINLRDSNGMTALHLAAFNRKLKRVKALIKNGADLCLRNNAGKSALHFVMKYVPRSLKTIEERMDSGLQVGNPENEYDHTVKMNFNLLLPSNSHNQIDYVSDVALFTEILNMHKSDPARLEKVLMHPLSLSFLHLKWQQVKWLYYSLILSCHLIYSITYSVYIVSVFNTLCKPGEIPGLADMDWSGRVFMHIPCDFHSPDHTIAHGAAIVSWILLIVFNVLYVSKEITKMFHLRSGYIREWESVLNALTIISFPLISFHSDPFSKDTMIMSSWQFHAAGVGVLNCWILMMFLIGKVPRFGKYVQMLHNVGWSFFNFFVAYSSLIIGFSLSFVVLFPREVSFREALTAPIKVMVMMTGELEYNDLYYPQRDHVFMNISHTNGNLSTAHGVLDDEDKPQPFPFTAHAVLTAFIVVISIVIMNLLFGMAVSDVQELYKKSRLHQSIQQVELISYMESILFSPTFYRLPIWLQNFLRRKLHGLEGRYRNIFEIEPDSYDEKKLLPSYLNKTVKDKCSEIQSKKQAEDSPHVSHQAVAAKLERVERHLEVLAGILTKLAPDLAAEVSKSNHNNVMTPELSLDDSMEDTSGFDTDCLDSARQMTTPVTTSSSILTSPSKSPQRTLGRIFEETPNCGQSNGMAKTVRY